MTPPGHPNREALASTTSPELFPWGGFRSPDLEAEYRAQQLTRDTRLAMIIIGLGQLSVIPVINDYRLFGLTPVFWSLVGARGVFVVASIIAWLALRRGPSPRRLDRHMLSWCLVLTGMNLYIVSTRPAGFLGHALGTVTLAMAFYALTPLPLPLQAVPALVTAAANLVLVSWFKPALDRLSLTTLAVTLVRVNALGATVSSHFHRSKRRQFLALRRETELRRRLQQALAEIRTLRGILPVCGYCKRVRTDVGEWQSLERYVSERTDANFSHGICPDCLQIHYPGIA